MAGRAVSRAKFDAEQQRLLEARSLPTEPRTEPATYTDELIPELLALADKGLTDAEIAAHWNVTEQALHDWTDTHSAFKAAVARARTRSKAWWERSARLAMAERDTRYPAGLFSHVMRARFAEYDDKDRTTVHIDLGSLVMITRPSPGLPSERRVTGPSTLIEHKTVGLTASPTASGDVEIRPVQPVRPGEGEGG